MKDRLTSLICSSIMLYFFSLALNGLPLSTLFSTFTLNTKFPTHFHTLLSLICFPAHLLIRSAVCVPFAMAHTEVFAYHSQNQQTLNCGGAL